MPRTCAVNLDHLQTVSKDKLGAVITVLPALPHGRGPLRPPVCPRLRTMKRLTIRLPDEKHERLRDLAERRCRLSTEDLDAPPAHPANSQTAGPPPRPPLRAG